MVDEPAHHEQRKRRIQAEEALHKSEVSNRALLNAVTDMIFRLSEDGTILDCLAGRPSDLRIPLEEQLGKKLHEVLAKDVADAQMHLIQLALQTGETHRYEYQSQVKGELRDNEVRFAACGDGEVLAVSGTR